MPKSVKISREKILDSAFQIAKEEGIEGINIRKIAKFMNSSIRPIYYQFDNMEDLKCELLKKIQNYFYEFLTSNMKEDIPQYKQTGINYIKFAKDEPILFQILFMAKTGLHPKDFITLDKEDYEEYEKIIKKCTNLKGEDIKEFHVKMWIFTHGIATLIATKTCNLTDKQISELLTEEFKALMLLENNKK